MVASLRVSTRLLFPDRRQLMMLSGSRRICGFASPIGASDGEHLPQREFLCRFSYSPLSGPELAI